MAIVKLFSNYYQIPYFGIIHYLILINGRFNSQIIL